ncbi:hypothetical protein NEOLEDRAFT_1166688 [Neolentinus lepideus HHB14362 ss-1]|uniref:Uncharacterized protein n=1 Tax=Neolentinus lepideus HHB14362 ss-1 TaxID=1314782 RepID=A0A165VLN0_9AGAM|nr:hypothetical protein NEOLEDRAFT_1166688 [Neolentinus lepideus HHB14362 ss-1]
MDKITYDDLKTVLMSEDCTNILDDLFNTKEKSARAEVQLSAYDDYGKIESTFRVELHDASGHAFLVWRDGGEEVVFDALGFLAASQLPPLSRNVRTSRTKAHLLMQSVSIVGPGSTRFARQLKAYELLYHFFDQSLGNARMKPMDRKTVGEIDTLFCQTRYLTLVPYNIWPVAPLPFATLDPHHTLESYIDGSRYVFTDDNVVDYMATEVDDENPAGEITYKVVAPSLFRIGHLVDVGINFRAVRGGDKLGLVTRMDSLLLVNRVGAKMLMERQLASTPAGSSSGHATSLAPKKRKLSFTTEGEEQTVRHKMQQLVLGDRERKGRKDDMEISV